MNINSLFPEIVPNQRSAVKKGKKNKKRNVCLFVCLSVSAGVTGNEHILLNRSFYFLKVFLKTKFSLFYSPCKCCI